MSECRYVLIAILVADSPPRRHRLLFFFFSARAAHVVLRTDASFRLPADNLARTLVFLCLWQDLCVPAVGRHAYAQGSLFKILPRNNALFTIVVTARY